MAGRGQAAVPGRARRSTRTGTGSGAVRPARLRPQHPAHRLAGIPAVLVHGRLDISAPLNTVWELSRAWPDAELIIVKDAGHLGNAATGAHLRAAVEVFAR
jgi:pimeloyl-ACP methyl ester carboxylesterase